MKEMAMTPMELAVRVYLKGSDTERKRRVGMLWDGIRCHERARRLEERSKELIGLLVSEVGEEKDE